MPLPQDDGRVCKNSIAKAPETFYKTPFMGGNGKYIHGVGTADRVFGSPGFISILRSMANKMLFLATVTGPDLLLAMAMTLILIVSVTAVGGHVNFFQATLGFPVGIMFTLIIYRSIVNRVKPDSKHNISIILRDWLPFLLIVFIYENLHGLGDYFYTHDFAAVFYKWDVVLFGVEPTLWMQKFHAPLLTDIMSVSYALYFILPLVMMFFLSQGDKRFEFREMALALTFSFIVGFAGYVIWPTSPPRYFITELFTDPVRLHGIVIFEFFQGAWDNLEATGFGAFPSLHVGISFVALLYAWKFRHMGRLYKWIWYLYIPLVLSLWISTVYLRHHWVVDIFAGCFVGLCGFVLSENILKLWRYLRKRYGLSH